MPSHRVENSFQTIFPVFFFAVKKKKKKRGNGIFVVGVRLPFFIVTRCDVIWKDIIKTIFSK